MAANVESSSDPSCAVRQLVGEARRVRSRLAGSPRQMHAALRDLTVRPPATRIVPSPLPPEETARLRFAREVIERLDGPILRYSMRLDLYKLARRLGLSLFDANLIIAQAQHARCDRGAAESTAAPRAWMIPALAVVTTQAAILGAGWAIFC